METWLWHLATRMETWVWHLATPLEGQVDAEGVDSRYGVAAVIYSEGGGATSQFRCVAGVVLPCLQVLYVDIDFQCLQAYFGKEGLVERVSKLHVTDAEEAAVFDVILRIQVVDRMFGVQQRLAVGGTFSVPAVHAL